LSLLILTTAVILTIMSPLSHSFAAGLALSALQLAQPVSGAVDVNWYPPTVRNVNNLTEALTGHGVYGFIYNSSKTPDAIYGTYNWCNMPHVRRREYKPAEKGYELRYVELVSEKSD
jgi:acid phosphatase